MVQANNMPSRVNDRSSSTNYMMVFDKKIDLNMTHTDDGI